MTKASDVMFWVGYRDVKKYYLYKLSVENIEYFRDGRIVADKPTYFESYAEARQAAEKAGFIVKPYKEDGKRKEMSKSKNAPKDESYHFYDGSYHFYVTDPVEFDLDRIEQDNPRAQVVLLRHSATSDVLVGIHKDWLQNFDVNDHQQYVGGERLSAQWGQRSIELSRDGFLYSLKCSSLYHRWIVVSSEEGARQDIAAARRWLTARIRIDVVQI